MGTNDMVSADEARALLEHITEGSWGCYDALHDDFEGAHGICVEGAGRPVALLRVIDGGTPADRDIAAAAPDLARTVVALHAELDAARAAEHSAIAHAEECGAELQKARKELAVLRRVIGTARLYVLHDDMCDDDSCECIAGELEEIAGPVVGRALSGTGSPADCREAMGMSLEDAAVASGVSVERIEAIERGEPATGDEFASLVDVYDVPGWVRPEVTP